MGFNIESAGSSNQYVQALATVANPDEIDINLVFVPGVNLSDHPIMCAAVQAMCEDRGDCFAILDASKKNVLVNTVTTYTDKYDTNYSAAYYP